MADVLRELKRVAAAMSDAGLEGVLIGNAAAALHGAPVGTTDLDFFVRSGGLTRKKILAVAEKLSRKKILAVSEKLGGVAIQPFAPVSYRYRIEGTPFPIDMVLVAHGIHSFDGLRRRSTVLPLGSGGRAVYVAALQDVIKSKRASARPKDLAVLSILEETLNEKERQEKA